MIRHLDEGILQALLDGELSDTERASARAHLDGCAACAAELRTLRAARERFGALLGGADVAPPAARAQMEFRRRRAAVRPPSVWTGARGALLKAAMVVLAVGLAGGVAAAVPGSPVREWVERIAGGPGERPALPPAAVEAPAPVARPAPAEAPAGVSIGLDRGAIRVVLTGAAEGLTVRTRLVDGDMAEVTASGAAAKARFRTSEGTIEVVGAGAGEVTVGLPRGARRATVEAEGRVRVAKEGAALRVPGAPAAEAAPVFRVGS